MISVSSSQYRLLASFKGILNNYEELEDDIDLGDLDASAYNLREDIDRLQPNRDPSLEFDYLGLSGDVELIFNCRITWMDRESDIEDYLDEVQGVIENGLDILIYERQVLGTRQTS